MQAKFDYYLIENDKETTKHRGTIIDERNKKHNATHVNDATTNVCGGGGGGVVGKPNLETTHQVLSAKHEGHPVEKPYPTDIY